MSLVLPITEWPATDRTMWEALYRKAGPLDQCGGLAHVRETTRVSLQARYGRWLRWLMDADPAALAEAPAARATIGRLKGWLSALAHTKPMSQLAFVSGTLRVLRAAAPDANWTDQRRIETHLKRAAGRGDPTRKAGRILCSSVLLEAGLRLAGPEADAATTPLEAAKRRRNGAMIAMLAVMPMRRRAFAGLLLGESIHVSKENILVSLPEELTKTGVPWETPVPASVAGVLRRYVTEVRPWLMARGRGDHQVLWVDDRGAPFQLNHLGNKIAGITERATGVRVPPHFFRDAAATTLARLSPDAARLISPVLAHSNVRTAARHYIHAGSIEAGRDLAALVKKLKSGAD